MFKERNDKGDYFLYKYEEAGSQHKDCQSWRVVFSEGLVKCLRILYDYSIGSCITSVSCSKYFRSDKPDHIEMNSYSASFTASVSGSKKTGPAFLAEKPPIETIRKLDKLMKERVNRHFENHIQKWKNRKRFPFKVILDLLLIILITTQAGLFAAENSKFTRFLIENEETFEHHFVKTKCNDQEVDDIKLYTLGDVYTQINRIVNSYYTVSELVGAFLYVDRNGTNTTIPPILEVRIDYNEIACGSNNQSEMFPNKRKRYYTIDLFPQKCNNTDTPNSNNQTYCDTKNNDDCCNYTESSNSRCSIDYCDCSVEQQVKCYIDGKNFERLDNVSFDFKLATYLRDKIISDDSSPVKAEFDIHIQLSNDQYSHMSIEIDIDPKLRRVKDCFKSFKSNTTITDIIVLSLILLSSITHIASFIRSFGLAKDLKLHFFAFHLKRLRWTDELSALFNKWYIFMLLTNIIILVAIILKLISEYRLKISIELIETVRVLLGSGVLLLWCGLFGLLSYFESLNVLFIAIRLAIPSVLRFAVCLIILFIAFVICGWLVLGPYHPKFDDFHYSLVSLFCILSGDDIYQTFAQAQSNKRSLPILIFSEIYLVVFIFIFIYAVLSLFIGIFNHAYESLSENWKEYSRGYLRDWAEGERDNDPTKSYPFPVPPVRNPATNIDDFQDDMESSTLSINGDPNEDIPTIQIVQPSNEQQEIPTIQIVGTSDEQPHGHVSEHHISHTSSSNHPPKLQVAQPPVATKLEVYDARFRLRGSFLSMSNEFEDDDDGRIN